MHMNRAMTMAAALAAILVVAGCSKQQPAENLTENTGAEQAPLPAPVPAPEPQAAAPIAKPAPPPADPVAPEAQILDDADATGMTARLSRGGEDEPAGNTAKAGDL
jgi:outer membrane murein-binding lipoprotein Lpp